MIKEILKACTIIDRMRMRVMIPMDKQVTAKEIDDFFKEVGYVPETLRDAFGRGNTTMANRQETTVSNMQEL